MGLVANAICGLTANNGCASSLLMRLSIKITVFCVHFDGRMMFSVWSLTVRAVVIK